MRAQRRSAARCGLCRCRGSLEQVSGECRRRSRCRWQVWAVLDPGRRRPPSCMPKAASSKVMVTSVRTMSSPRWRGVGRGWRCRRHRRRSRRRCRPECRSPNPPKPPKPAPPKPPPPPPGFIVGVDAREAVLVVPGALVRVGEHLVGLVDLLEFGLGFLVAGVQVGVVLLGQLAVGLFDFIIRWRPSARPSTS